MNVRSHPAVGPHHPVEARSLTQGESRSIGEILAPVIVLAIVVLIGCVLGG